MTRTRSRSRGAPSRKGERGAATSAAVVVLAVLLLLTSALVAGAGVLVSQRRAAAVADLAALAGAVAVQRGDDPCAATEELVARSRAALAHCAVVGEDVRVVVRVELGDVAGLPLRVSARGRAGPRRG